ncbi:response regulator transcription factor [Arachnia propionica]|uniref:response regulator transcription factor n=1 Tax=Arachnia propionica TaxID=1750 RepID=UPI000F6DE284|nr:LuxR C-terminal-related transcriptional regulator [Arachnia propionica]VEJ58118.1 Bacterial regulatory proteins, luxR family [Arachnia propionica]
MPLTLIFTAGALTGAQCGSWMTKEVLRLAASSDDAQSIAKALRIGEGTARNHLSSATAKTQARNRTEAARTAERNGWL